VEEAGVWPGVRDRQPRRRPLLEPLRRRHQQRRHRQGAGRAVPDAARDARHVLRRGAGDGEQRPQDAGGGQGPHRRAGLARGKGAGRRAHADAVGRPSARGLQPGDPVAARPRQGPQAERGRAKGGPVLDTEPLQATTRSAAVARRACARARTSRSCPDDPNVLAYLRRTKNSAVLVALNMSTSIPTLRRRARGPGPQEHDGPGAGRDVATDEQVVRWTPSPCGRSRWSSPTSGPVVSPRHPVFDGQPGQPAEPS
jgi:hypothetical protein